MRIRIEMFASLTSLAAAATILAGCGGSSGMPGASTLPGASGSMTTQSVNRGPAVPADRNGCRHSGGVQISPCVIAFGSKNPGPAIVKVDSSNHRVIETTTARGAASLRSLPTRTERIRSRPAPPPVIVRG